ncbi:hypothetical protein CRYPA_1272 [uncultured Candidatus Thioglobus sp.]|nr:hypothetical protein CRYPA_1272 [uncultured Candidatus Thioglobus sp.]
MWLDRNLGATQVAASSTDSAAYGDLYQWGTNGICPAGFSVPTEAEITADTISATTTDITNSATAFSSFLKIPVAGYRHRSDGGLYNVGTSAYLWSRSAAGRDGRHLYLKSGRAFFVSSNRAHGFSVRCIKD